MIANYKDGPLSVAEEFKPYLNNEVVKDGLSHIREAFKDIRSNGPAWVANFYNISDEREYQMKIADAYKNVSKFLELLG